MLQGPRLALLRTAGPGSPFSITCSLGGSVPFQVSCRRCLLHSEPRSLLPATCLLTDGWTPSSHLPSTVQSASGPCPKHSCDLCPIPCLSFPTHHVSVSKKSSLFYRSLSIPIALKFPFPFPNPQPSAQPHTPWSGPMDLVGIF